MKKILITGATGFLGRYLIEHFQAAGYRIRLLVRNPARLNFRRGSLEVITGDLADPGTLKRAVQDMSAVIHAAALSSFWEGEHERMFLVNVEGTRNLVEACIEANVEKLVHIGSTTQLGIPTQAHSTIHEKNAPADERSDTGAEFLNMYARTKYLAGQEVLAGVEKGLPAVSVLPGIMIGPGDWNQGSPSFFAMAARGKLKFTPTGNYGLVDVRDVARGTEILLESERKRGESCIMVSKNMSAGEFFQRVARSVGTQIVDRPPPIKLLKTAGGFLEKISGITGREPVLTKEKAAMLTREKEILYSGELFRKEFQFTYTDIQATIKATGEAYLAEQRKT